MRFPVFLMVILFLGLVLGHVPGLILAAILPAVGYFASLQLNPRTRHRPCRGTGRVSGRLYTWTWHRCAGCAGRGQAIRRGAAHWGSQHVRDEAARQASAAAENKRRGAWR